MTHVCGEVSRDAASRGVPRLQIGAMRTQTEPTAPGRLSKEAAVADNIMSSRPHEKSPPGFPKKPEFSFHLVAKKLTASSTSVVAGAIVSGPVAMLFDDAMGTAFDGGSQTDSQKKHSLKSASKKSAKTRSKGYRTR